MKPLKISMQAFESYEDKTVFDFTPYENSLFLLDGDTGAGKTSVFDAMIYALYGVSSGGERSEKDFFNRHVSLDSTMEVVFDFAIREKKYEVRRSYRIARKRKDGTFERYTNPKHEQSLTGDGISVPLTKKSEVDDKLTKLIGLSVSQFKSTMMLAQGQFYDLVMADTKDRSAILRTILNTKILDDLSISIKSDLDKASNDLKSSETVIANSFSHFVADNPDLNNLFSNKEEVIGNVKDNIEKAEEYQKELNKKITELDEKSKTLGIEDTEFTRELTTRENDNKNLAFYKDNLTKLTGLEEKKTEITELSQKIDAKEKADKILSLKKNADSDKKERETEELKLKGFKEQEPVKKRLLETKKNEYETAYPQLQQALEKNAARLSQLKKTADDFKALQTKKQGLSSAEKELEKFSKLLLDQTNELKEKKDKAAELTKVHEGNRDLLNQKTVKENQMQKLQQDQDELKGYLQKLDDLNDDKELKNQGRKTDELRVKATETENLRSEVLKAYIGNSAYHLSLELKEGEPCPVCGSRHHPVHALPAGKNVEYSDYEKADKEFKKAEKELNDALTLYNGLVEKRKQQLADVLVSASNVLKKELTAENGHEEIENEIGFISANIVLYRNDINELTERIKADNKTVSDIAVLSKDADSLSKAIEETREKKDEALTQKSSLAESVRELEQELSGKSEEELIKEEKSLESGQEETRNRIAGLNQELSDITKDYQALAVQLTTSEEHLVSDKEKEEESSREYQEALNISGFRSIEEAESASQLPDVLLKKKTVDEFNDSYLAIKGIHEDYIRKGYQNLSFTDLTDLKEKATAKHNVYLGVVGQLSDLRSTYSSNQKILKDIRAEHETSQNKFNEFDMLNELYNLATGKTADNHINFETYYQAVIFDEILLRAGEKFYMMTGRYHLLRNAETENAGRGQTGLEINVEDDYDGTIGSIRSLSGGECFMAALSLALSLSEVVSEKSGGIELDCMFIDEGFGTLGEKYINDAVKVLRNLSSHTDRMIGVISHVDKLRELIPDQVLVYKDAHGSHLKPKLKDN